MPRYRKTDALYAVTAFTSFAEMLDRNAAAYPHLPALADLTPTPVPKLTHAELRSAVLAFSAALRALDVREGEHIAVLSENRVQWCVAYLAAISMNCVAVPIDRNLRENEVVSILHASGSRAAVFSEAYRDMFEGFRATLPELSLLVDMDLPVKRGAVESMPALLAAHTTEAGAVFPPARPDALAVLVYTSGSMGSAKGVMLSQANICANLVAMRSMIEIPPSDRFLSVLPIHHTYECTCGFLCPISSGASTTFARSLKTVADDIRTVRPTVLLGVPLLYEKMYRRIVQGIAEKKLAALLVRPLSTVAGMLESLGAGPLRKKIFHEIHERFGGAIRMFIVGGAAPDPAVAAGFRSFGFTFVQGYGLTETSPIVALNRLGNTRDDAAGLPLPNLDVRIEAPDDDGRGEILVRGPSVMMGYYKNDEATRAAIDSEGWFRTGDFGSIDADGFLHINGRKKNVIIAKNGKNVFPEELEEQVNRMPCVLESFVYADTSKGDEHIAVRIVPNAEHFIELAHKTGGEVTRAIIEETINNEIRGLNKRLPVYKQIRRVTIQDTEFEKTTTQKIKRYLVGR